MRLQVAKDPLQCGFPLVHGGNGKPFCSEVSIPQQSERYTP
jgi:hypothetical protein